MTEIIPYLFVRDVAAALDFYIRAFGFAEEMRTGTPSGGVHAEMRLDGQAVMMGQGGAGHGDGAPGTRGATMGVFVWIADVDAHHAHAAAAGAQIDHPPRDESYGRTYAARDPDGHPWFFTARTDKLASS